MATAMKLVTLKVPPDLWRTFEKKIIRKLKSEPDEKARKRLNKSFIIREGIKTWIKNN